MFIFKSLYFRMTIVHVIGIVLLPINAIFFTQGLISQIIQITIALALVVHELDERKNGNNLSKKLIEFLKEMDNKDVSLKINTSMASEYSQIKSIIDKREESLIKKENEDLILLKEAKEVMNKLKKGDFSSTITTKTTDQSLRVKKEVNEMIKDTKSHYLLINSILEKYTNYDYTNTLSLENISSNGQLKTLVNAINKLKEAITQMLIEKTINIIKDVASTSEEQRLGIIQINEAVSVLEQQIYSNTEVSNQTNEIALKTSDIANTVVHNANKKQFEGKSELKN